MKLLRFIFLLICLNSCDRVFAQTFNQALTLTNLLTQTPVSGGLYIVQGYHVAGDWGAGRIAQHVPGSTATTTIGNEFTFGTGRLHFLDATNAVQDLRWWLNRPAGSDISASLLAVQTWITNRFGSGVVTFPGTVLVATNTLTKISGIHWRGLGRRISYVSGTGMPSDADTVLQSGTVGSSMRLAVAVIAGTNTISIAGASTNFSIGDLILIGDTNLFSYSPFRSYYQKGEYLTVASVTNDSIRCIQSTKLPYSTNTTLAYRVEPNVGNIEGIGFVNPLMGQGVHLLLCAESKLEDVESTGSDYMNFNLNTSIGIDVQDCYGEWASDESLGLNYIIGIVGLQDSKINGGGFTSSRHGLTMGNATYPFVNRNVVVSGAMINGYSLTVHGGDVHGIAEDITFENCTFPNGLSVGGNRINIIGNRISNGNLTTAISYGEQMGAAVKIQGNDFLLQRPGPSATVTAFRAYYDRGGGSSGGTPGNTNTWAGDNTSSRSDRMVISDNDVYQLSGSTPTGTSEFLFFVDSDLNTNGLARATFAGLDFFDNRIHTAGQNPLQVATQVGLVLLPANYCVFDSVIARNNDMGPYGFNIRPLGTHLEIARNTIVDSVAYDRSAIEIGYTVGTVQLRGGDTIISGNRIEGAFGSAIGFSSALGRLTMRDNVLRDWGRGSTNLYGVILTRGGGQDTNTVAALLADNVYERRDTVQALVPLYFAMPSATLTRINDIEINMSSGMFLSTSAGMRTASGTNDWRWSVPGVTDALVVNTNQLLSAGPVGLGSKTTAQLTALTNLIASGAVAYNTDLQQVQMLTNATWVSLRDVNNFRFDQVYSTNQVRGSNIVGSTLSLGATDSVTASTTGPVYIYRSVDNLQRVYVVNTSTHTDAGSGVELQSVGVNGRISAYSMNNTSGNVLARLQMASILGNGLAFDIALPTSQDMVGTYGGGVEFWRWNTNGLSFRANSTASTLTHMGGWLVSPAGQNREFHSFPVSTVLTAIGAQPLDTDLTRISAVGWALGDFAYRDSVGLTNFASTPVGRALFNAATVSVQRSALELGALATAAEAPDDGQEYLRRDTTWVLPVDDAYGAGWNGSVAVPTKNSLYDKIQTLLTDAPSDGSEYVRKDAAWAVASGGGGGIAGIRAWNDYGTIDGVTNLFVGAALGSGLDVVLSDSTPDAVLEIDNVAPGFLVNGSGPANGLARWNLNSTTPAAPTGFRNFGISANSTNVVITNAAPYFISVTQVGTNNSSSEFIFWTNSAAIPINFLRDGGRATVRAKTMSVNNTGANRVLTHKLYVGATPTVFTITDNNQGATSSARENDIEFTILRSGTNLFVKGLNRVDTAPGTPQSGSTLAVTASTANNGPTYMMGVPSPDSNAIALSLSATMGVASGSYYATNIYTHITPQ